MQEHALPGDLEIKTCPAGGVVKESDDGFTCIYKGARLRYEFKKSEAGNFEESRRTEYEKEPPVESLISALVIAYRSPCNEGFPGTFGALKFSQGPGSPRYTLLAKTPKDKIVEVTWNCRDLSEDGGDERRDMFPNHVNVDVFGTDVTRFSPEIKYRTKTDAWVTAEIFKPRGHEVPSVCTFENGEDSIAVVAARPNGRHVSIFHNLNAAPESKSATFYCSTMFQASQDANDKKAQIEKLRKEENEAPPSKKQGIYSKIAAIEKGIVSASRKSAHCPTGKRVVDASVRAGNGSWKCEDAIERPFSKICPVAGMIANVEVGTLFLSKKDGKIHNAGAVHCAFEACPVGFTRYSDSCTRCPDGTREDLVETRKGQGKGSIQAANLLCRGPLEIIIKRYERPSAPSEKESKN